MVRLAIAFGSGVVGVVMMRVAVTRNPSDVIKAMGDSYARSIRIAMGGPIETGGSWEKPTPKPKNITPRNYQEYDESKPADPTFEEWWDQYI